MARDGLVKATARIVQIYLLRGNVAEGRVECIDVVLLTLRTALPFFHRPRSSRPISQKVADQTEGATSSRGSLSVVVGMRRCEARNMRRGRMATDLGLCFLGVRFLGLHFIRVRFRGAINTGILNP